MSLEDAGFRIVVIGPSCSGKSTFARALAQAGGAPCIDLDDLYWMPKWQPRDADGFLQQVREGAAATEWVAAGNYRLARQALWSRATAIVWLDLSLPRVLWRCLVRTWLRCSRRELLAHGNRESFRRAFLSRDSLFLWILETHGRRRAEFAALRASGEYPHLTWFQACNAREAARLLREMQRRWHPRDREEQQATPR